MTLWGLTTVPDVAALKVGHQADISSIAWNGQHLVSADCDGVVCRWSTAGVLTEIHAVDDASAALLSSDGTMVATDGPDAISLWSLNSLACVGRRTKGVLDRGIKGFDWSIDGRTIASMTFSALLVHRASGPGTYKMVHELKVQPNSRPLWSPTVDALAIVEDNTVAIRAAPDYRPIVQICAAAEIVSAAWSPSGAYIAALTYKRPQLFGGERPTTHLQVWNSANGSLVHDTHFGKRIRGVREVGCVAWAPEGEQTLLLTATTKDGAHDLILFKLGDVSPYRRVRILDGTPASIPFKHVVWDLESGKIALAGNRTIVFVDPSDLSPEVVPAINLQQRKHVWLPGLQKIALATRVGALIRDTSTGITTELPAVFAEELGSTNVVWSPNGDRIAASNFYGFAVWETANNTLVVKQRDGLQEGGSRLTWSPDGRYLARSSGDFFGRGPSQLSIWDALDWTHTTTLFAIRRVAWANDGRMLAVYSDEGTIRILRTGSWDPVVEFATGPDVVNFVFSPDVNTLAVAFNNGAISLIESNSGYLRARCIGLPDGSNLISWCQDSRTLAVAGEDHMIYIWRCPDVTLTAIIDPSVRHSEVLRDSDHRRKESITDIFWTGPHTLNAIAGSGNHLIWQVPCTLQDVRRAVPSPRRATPKIVRDRFKLL